MFALALIAVSGSLSSCITLTDPDTPMAGYNEKQVYNRGFSDGSTDRLSGRAHNPHINEPVTLSSAYRKQYLWGYVEGYKNPYAHGGAPSSK